MYVLAALLLLGVSLIFYRKRKILAKPGMFYEGKRDYVCPDQLRLILCPAANFLSVPLHTKASWQVSNCCCASTLLVNV